jgi:hypothetical protein
MTTQTLATLEDLNNKAFVTDFVRLLQFPQFTLGQFFPDEKIAGIQYRWNSTSLYQEPAITYKAWDTETTIGSRPGVSRKSAELPPLGKKKIMTEEHTIRLEALQTGEWGPYVATAFDDITNLTEGAHARWEFDRATLLSTGALTVSGPSNGTSPAWTQSISYGVPGGNIVTASPLWTSTSTADPLLDFETWCAAYAILNRGLRPGVCLISRAIAANILRNAALRALLYYGAPNTGPSVLPLGAVNEELAARNLPRLVIVDEQATASDGTFGYVLPQNKAILLPDPATGLFVGRTVQGITAEALGMVPAGSNVSIDNAGLVGSSWMNPGGDPPVRFNKVNGTGMPVISNPNLLMIATVG